MKTVITRPYEFLVRWRDGVISGAHVGFEDAIVEDGKVIGATPLPVQAVDIGSGQGFPLQDILTAMGADAFVRIGELEAEVRGLKAAQASNEKAKV
jgi:hypothetical protein